MGVHAKMMTTDEIDRATDGSMAVATLDGPVRTFTVHHCSVGWLLVQEVTVADGFQDNKRWTLTFAGVHSMAYADAVTYAAVVVARDKARLSGDVEPERIGNQHDAYDAFN
jgi:hypothetical protein